MSEPLRVGSIDESFYEVVAEVVRFALESAGHETTLAAASHTEAYAAVASGETDLCVAFWLPTGHAAAWRAAGDRVVEIGTLYEGAQFFWAVNAFCDDRIRAIGDLADPALAAPFARLIRGLSLDATITTASQIAIDAYGLRASGFFVEPGAFGPWTEALAEAERTRRPIVMPLWQPYHLNAIHDLRRLADPLNVFGSENRVVLAAHAASRSRLSARALEILERLDLTIADVTGLDEIANADGISAREAVKRWTSDHADRVARWVA